MIENVLTTAYGTRIKEEAIERLEERGFQDVDVRIWEDPGQVDRWKLTVIAEWSHRDQAFTEVKAVTLPLKVSLFDLVKAFLQVEQCLADHPASAGCPIVVLERVPVACTSSRIYG